MSLDYEEQYFLNDLADRRREKRAELEKAAREAAAKEALSETLDLNSDALLERVRALGFDGDTGRMFDVLPLIYVAWADGRVQPAERASILEVLRIRDISPDSEAWLFTEALLEQRPSDDYMALTLQLLKDVHAANGHSATTLLELSSAVAEAAGGFLGLTSPVSDDELAVLKKIADKLGVSESTLQQVLAK